MSSEAAFAQVGESWGHLTLRRDLGAGPRGLAYRAWDPALGQDVLLAITPDVQTDPSGRDTLRDARALTRIRHQNLATVYGAERRHTRVGVWLELVDGGCRASTVANHSGRATARNFSTTATSAN
jgi:hypothetical protein